MPISFSNLQTGHTYRIQNYDEVIEFVVVDLQPDGDIRAKHLQTLEIFHLSEIIKYGKGKNYDLVEILENGDD